MLYFSLPPSRERYLAEIKNLLNVRTRPLCIMGVPRVSFDSLIRHFKSNMITNNTFYVDDNLITYCNDCLIISQPNLK